MAKSNNLSRRQFLKTTGAVAMASSVAGFSDVLAVRDWSHPGRGLRGRPNILLMLVDEMRYPPVFEGLGAQQFRQTYLKTQNALRASGVEFHRHYAAATACAPSRASIFTGHYPSLHGVTQTTGAAKEENDPDVFWLDPASVPTMGDYFQAGGYRTFYKGKWHVSNADLQIPGTHDQLLSYDDQGNPDPGKQQLYLEADRLADYGFEGWIGPEPHGKAPLNTGSSPAQGQGRDVGFATQVVNLIQQLGTERHSAPWLTVASLVNPHDIALWGYVARHTGLFNFTVEDIVPAFTELFDPVMFAQTLADDLTTKPSCQQSYQESYNEWMQGVPPHDYFRFYYQLHKNVDDELYKLYQALQQSPFYDNTIVIFTSDHGDLLGAHRYMHQKWYQAYDEAVRVPLIISNPHLFPEPRSIDSVTSHVDLLPTLLSLARLKQARLRRKVAKGHSDPVPLVGRNLRRLVLGRNRRPVADPVYFMTDDDMSRGLDQENFIGIAYGSVIQPSHVETVIVEIDGEVWKYSRYFDNKQFWSDPSQPKDVVTQVENKLIDPPAGTYDVNATQSFKYEPEPDEYEMYNVTQDPMELDNLYGNLVYAAMQTHLATLLDQQRAQKRLTPISGVVPGQ
ncbi:Arylsulfatase A-like enzyme [Nitrosococcus oceani ATCC 19707]|uniref:Arylsulfatase A-like enzyme n=3 Tax=Nitrosococcus oceani TaxID=1229 RepID=Q3JEL9_NITOC|nr:Arylsulfatase A-like enzyme [Nitrosococcus oceani ATCC 19707]